MTEKKPALGKKASETKDEKKVIEKLSPKKVEKKEVKAIGRKASVPSIKIEVKNVPDIVNYEKKKIEPQEKKETVSAKLPAKATGNIAKMDKLKSSLKKAVLETKEEVEPVLVAPEPTSSISSTQLELASTRRNIATVKKSNVAPGKASLDELFKSAVPQQEETPQPAPFFDVNKYLKG